MSYYTLRICTGTRVVRLQPHPPIKLCRCCRATFCCAQENEHFLCGMQPFVSDNTLHGVIIARGSLECHDHVDFDYYNSSNHQEPWYEPNLCAYCANTSGSEGILDKNLLKEWKAVLPLCEACRASGALPLVHYYAVRNNGAA